MPRQGELVDFLGLVQLTAIGFDAAVQRIADRPAGAPFAYVVTPNAAHVVALSRPGNRLAAPYAGAWMRLCDSQVIRLIASRMFGDPIDLVTGSDLTDALLRRVIRPQDPITLIGGDATLAEALRARFGLGPIAQHVPPMGYGNDPAEVERCAAFVASHKARFVFLATGMPQSELLALRIAQRGDATGVGLAVGSALEFAAGRVRRAPPVMRRLGLEWLFRLLSEPRRLLRRYAIDSPPILRLAIAEWRRRRRRG